MNIARNVICWRRLTRPFPSDRGLRWLRPRLRLPLRSQPVVDGVDEAAQLELYSVADRLPGPKNVPGGTDMLGK